MTPLPARPGPSERVRVGEVHARAGPHGRAECRTAGQSRWGRSQLPKDQVAGHFRMKGQIDKFPLLGEGELVDRLDHAIRH
jgi:hypothetical protein